MEAAHSNNPPSQLSLANTQPNLSQESDDNEDSNWNGNVNVNTSDIPYAYNTQGKI